MTQQERKQLSKYYPTEGFHIEEIDDTEKIAMYYHSRMVICWGNGPIEGTRFYKLCHASPQRKGDKQLILVCDKHLVEQKGQVTR